MVDTTVAVQVVYTRSPTQSPSRGPLQFPRRFQACGLRLAPHLPRGPHLVFVPPKPSSAPSSSPPTVTPQRHLTHPRPPTCLHRRACRRSIRRRPLRRPLRRPQRWPRVGYNGPYNGSYDGPYGPYVAPTAPQSDSPADGRRNQTGDAGDTTGTVDDEEGGDDTTTLSPSPTRDPSTRPSPEPRLTTARRVQGRCPGLWPDWRCRSRRRRCRWRRLVALFSTKSAT